jgi:hypothetical protein
VNRYGLGVPEQRRAAADARPRSAPAAGLSWWGAVLIAVTSTLIGLAIEAGLGHKELGGVFAAFYALGCLAAVLTVRYSGIFTAVIQPPLLLFVAVPLAYYLFHESAFGGLKDILITCGYPLIERFPLMLFTSAAVLLIGLVRWYRATSAPSRPQPAAPAGAERPGLLAALSTKLASAFAGNGSVDEKAGSRPARPRHVVDRQSPPRSRRSSERGATRSRHARRPVEEFVDTPPRRRQPTGRPARDSEWDAEPRRRSRQQADPRRTPPPARRERRPDYRDQPPPRGGRLDPYESGRGYQSPPPYDPYPPYEPRRRPPAPDRHPVSRVRYRDSGPPEPDYDGPRPRR